MKNTKVVKLAALPALAAALLAATATPALAATARRDRPELRKSVQAFVDAGFLGVQVRVSDERGEWAGSAGVRKLGSAARPPVDGRFWTGSVVKPFTATVVLQLVAEGKVRLDHRQRRRLGEPAFSQLRAGGAGAAGVVEEAAF
ncbi:serine hydrolase [Nonomuraea typhae]|uniref:serine hydrolase n=1 Tax=Nonomuraea typhae TaxID=2603600 RepID=UPI001C6778A7|nr:serine hydrolase [Nonomuraea typhae]